MAVYLSVGTGAAEGVADPLLGIPSPLGQDFVPSLTGCGGAHQLLLFLSLPLGYIPVNRTFFCLECELSLPVCLTCVMPSLFDPPSTALGYQFAESDHKIELFYLFPCQSSLLLTAAEQPSSGHILHSQTAGTLAVS